MTDTDRACRHGYLHCACATATPRASHRDLEPLYAAAVEGAAASIVAQALRELGYDCERADDRAYLVDGERVEASEMWELYIGPIVGAKV